MDMCSDVLFIILNYPMCNDDDLSAAVGRSGDHSFTNEDKEFDLQAMGVFENGP